MCSKGPPRLWTFNEHGWTHATWNSEFWPRTTPTVTTDGSQKPDSDGLRPDRRRWWPGETAHLAVDGAEETLCAARVSGFVLVDGVDRDDADVPWCWVCTSTAGE